MVQATDLVIDDLGRPRVVLFDHQGIFHTGFADGWSSLEQLMVVSLDPIGLGAARVRFERDGASRAHVIFWTDVWNGGGGGRRSYHLLDTGTGFGEANHFNSGAWVPHAAPDAAGNLHVVGIDAFAPQEPDTPHQFQAVYWKWTPAGGWPEPQQVSFEPNPPTGNGAGPVGFSPEVAVDAAGKVHVVYPMHATDNAIDGEVHCIDDVGGSWSAPSALFPTNGDDLDDDGVNDDSDLCPGFPDAQQRDSDGDGIGDACARQLDEDGDGHLTPWDCDDHDPLANPDNPAACEEVSGSGGHDPGGGGPGTPNGADEGNEADSSSDGLFGGCDCRAAGGGRPSPPELPWLLLGMSLAAAARRRP